MPSRINIGPEDGPYVAINESSGNLQLEDNSGNVVAEWDDGQSQWDFVENDISGVGAFDSESVNTESATIGGQASELHFERVFRDDGQLLNYDDGDGDYYDIDLNGNSEYRLHYNAVFTDPPRDIYIRFNGDGDDTGDYYYYDDSSTFISSEDELPLMRFTSNATAFGTCWIAEGRYQDDHREGIVNKTVPHPENVDEFCREGVRDNVDGLTSMQIYLDGVTDLSNGVIELWERDFE